MISVVIVTVDDGETHKARGTFDDVSRAYAFSKRQAGGRSCRVEWSYDARA